MLADKIFFAEKFLDCLASFFGVRECSKDVALVISVSFSVSLGFFTFIYASRSLGSGSLDFLITILGFSSSGLVPSAQRCRQPPLWSKSSEHHRVCSFFLGFAIVEFPSF